MRSTEATFLILELTVDPFPSRAGQECHNTANVCGHSASLQGASIRQSLFDILKRRVLVAAGRIPPRVLQPHVALHTSRGNRINCAALLTEVSRKAACEALHCTLAAGIQGVSRNTHTCGDGRHQHNPATRLDVLVGVLSDEELGARVEIEDFVEVFQGGIGEGDEFFCAGVGHNDVQLTKVLDNLLEERLDGVDLGQVGLERGGVAAEGLDLLHHLLGGVRVSRVVDGYRCAFLGQLESNAGANASAASSDKGDLAGELILSGVWVSYNHLGEREV